MPAITFSQTPTAKLLSENQRATGASDLARARHDLFILEKLETLKEHIDDAADFVSDFQSAEKAPGGKSLALLRQSILLAQQNLNAYPNIVRQQIDAAVERPDDTLDDDEDE